MTDRRDFIKTAGIAAGAAMMPRFSFASVKGSDRIKVGLIGCGARGTAAATNMIQADQNIEIVALADLFEDKPALAEKRISDFCAANFPKEKGDIIKEGKVKKFFGWDCADQLLKEDVDVVIEATPPVFRTPHYAKIVEAGKHAFLEKPACVDAVQARKMLELSKKADEKGLSVVCGTQRRYHEAYQEITKRIHDGMIGDIIAPNAIGMTAGMSGTPSTTRKRRLSRPIPWSIRFATGGLSSGARATILSSSMCTISTSRCGLSATTASLWTCALGAAEAPICPSPFTETASATSPPISTWGAARA